LDELFLYTVPELLDLELFSSSFAAARSSVICKAIFVLESFLLWCPVLSRRSVLIFPAQSIATGLGSAVVFNFYRSHLFFLLQCSSGPLPVLLAPGIFMFPAGAVQAASVQQQMRPWFLPVGLESLPLTAIFHPFLRTFLWFCHSLFHCCWVLISVPLGALVA
jgi:hypothetical protein